MRTALGLIATALLAVPSLASGIGVSVHLGDPGFYGPIELGDAPAPRFIYGKPIIVVPQPVAGGPVYLRVPPGHARHWSKHCAEYGACGRPVYFVRNDWYTNVYAPHYREHHGNPEGGNGKSKGHNKGHKD